MENKNFANLNGKIFTDDELVSKVLGEVKSANPLVFYRALSKNPEIDKLLKKPSIVLRPFSYAKPGIKRDIPFGYGGLSPVLLRIIDPAGHWEDTSRYLGGGSAPWSEAFNLNPVNLRKISQGNFKISDVYRQVGTKNSDDDTIWQGTYIADPLTDKQKIGLLGKLKNDEGFLKELHQRAIHYKPSAHPMMNKLNEKYMQYFDWAHNLSPEEVNNPSTKKILKELQKQIYDLKKKV